MGQTLESNLGPHPRLLPFLPSWVSRFPDSLGLQAGPSPPPHPTPAPSCIPPGWASSPSSSSCPSFCPVSRTWVMEPASPAAPGLSSLPITTTPQNQRGFSEKQIPWGPSPAEPGLRPLGAQGSGLHTLGSKPAPEKWTSEAQRLLRPLQISNSRNSGITL